MKFQLIKVIVILLCYSVVVQAANSPFLHNKTALEDARRDATGRVWAYKPYDEKRALYTWKDSQWQPIFLPVLDKTRIEKLSQRPNGAVICLGLYQGAASGTGSGAGVGSGTPQIVLNPPKTTLYPFRLVEIQGTKSRLLAKFQARFESSEMQMIADHANVWLTTKGQDIYRIGPEGKFIHCYHASAQQFQGTGRVDNNPDSYNPLQMVRDGRGHAWFWSDVWTKGVYAFNLRGILIWDGRNFVHHATLPGLPRKSYFINTLGYKDARHLWLAISEHGLYEVDIYTLKARRVPDPEPKAFRYVQQIKSVGNDFYLVAGSRWGSEWNYDTSVRTGTLWRLRAGQWHKLINGLDKGADDLWESPRPLLNTPDGLWVGAFGGGAWYVPRQGDREATPVEVNWQRGFALHSVEGLLLQDRSKILAFGAHEGTVLIPHSRIVLTQRWAKRVRTFQTYCSHLAQDKHGHLWGSLSLQGNALNQWNGERWLSYAVPRHYKLDNASEFAIDGRDRVWIIPDSREAQTAIFDPSQPESKAWTVYASYPKALQAQLRQFGNHLGARACPLPDRVPLRSGTYPYLLPDFSSDGRICYRNLNNQLVYFDGKAWHKWQRQQVTKRKDDTNRPFYSPPFFNSSGALCVNIDDVTWQWNSNDWQARTREKYPRPGAQQDDPTEGNSLVGAPFPIPEEYHSYNVRDNRGMVWVVLKHQLYKVMDGLWSPQFAPHENHPFLDKRFFNQVFIDRRGNVIFNTAYGYTEFVMLMNSGSNPNTKVQAKTNSVDCFTLTFISTATGQRWFKWRLDKGPWSKPQSTSLVRLNELPGGWHQVEVVSINRDLKIDPTPGVVKFLVKIDPVQQVASLIKDLSAPDFERREAAVRKLVKQPTRAIPALKSARTKADDSARWWIDAAIQQCEENLRATEDRR